MAKFTNASGASLFLPDQTEIAKGDDVEIPDAMAKNAGVTGWIAVGALVPVKAKK